MKDNLRCENGESKIMRLSSVKSKIIEKNYWVFYVIKKTIFFSFFLLVDISAETWNKARVSVIRVHENDNANKTLCISDVKKDGVVKIFMTWLIKKLKENMGLKTRVILQNNKLESVK